MLHAYSVVRHLVRIHDLSVVGPPRGRAPVAGWSDVARAGPALDRTAVSSCQSARFPPIVLATQTCERHHFAHDRRSCTIAPTVPLRGAALTESTATQEPRSPTLTHPAAPWPAGTWGADSPQFTDHVSPPMRPLDRSPRRASVPPKSTQVEFVDVIKPPESTARAGVLKPAQSQSQTRAASFFANARGTVPSAS
jgi:hypothetical protein